MMTEEFQVVSNILHLISQYYESDNTIANKSQ
jgi:hypothetical protein